VEYQQDKTSQLFELNQWQDIIHTEEWRCFLKMLVTHKQYLQLRVNSNLREHNDRKAGEELAKFDDCDRLASLVKKRIAELRTNQEGEK